MGRIKLWCVCPPPSERYQYAVNVHLYTWTEGWGVKFICPHELEEDGWVGLQAGLGHTTASTQGCSGEVQPYVPCAADAGPTLGLTLHIVVKGMLCGSGAGLDLPARPSM